MNEIEKLVDGTIAAFHVESSGDTKHILLRLIEQSLQILAMELRDNQEKVT